MTNILWFRRNLRLDDNISLYNASKGNTPFLCIYVLDPNIMIKCSKRQSFLAEQLCIISKQLEAKGQKLHVFYGDPQIIIPEIAKSLQSQKIYADYEFTEYAQNRDKTIQDRISPTKLELNNDHLLFHPRKILKDDGLPYHIFTPYMRKFRRVLAEENIDIIENNIKPQQLECNWSKINIQPLEFSTAQELLEQCNFQYSQNQFWHPKNAETDFKNFITHDIDNYHHKRDYMSQCGTSKLSPYIAHGILSIRKLYLSASFMDNQGREVWVNELIWREFYAMLLYYYPNISQEEMQKQYRAITWNSDAEVLKRIYNAQTGFPIIDSAIVELLTTGWMHNRMRMIFASFFTKNLFLDWRLGEKFFAQHLIDYEPASNIGGWQWAASVGTDAQPYFRVFNPILQAQKFDPDAVYIKQYLPELNNVPAKDLHNPHNLKERYGANYPEPIIDLKKSRAQAIAKFKHARE